MSIREEYPKLDSQLQTWGSLSVNTEVLRQLSLTLPRSVLARICNIERLLYIPTPFTLDFVLGLKGLSVNILKKRSMMMTGTLRVFGKTDLQNYLKKRIENVKQLFEQKVCVSPTVDRQAQQTDSSRLPQRKPPGLPCQVLNSLPHAAQ